MASTTEHVRIHYRRPPDREEIFDQVVLARTPACVVTFLEAAQVSRPLRIEGETVLETGSPIVWFTFVDAWHDIGRFHTADGEFRGLYANVLTPVEGIDTGTWFTTDLFLDVWRDPVGATRVLDEDELAAAVRSGDVAGSLARRAEDEAAAIVAAARDGTWPPRIVGEWSLERALGALATDGTPRRRPV